MKNRNMFYQNTMESYQNPGMFIPPSGYNMNSQMEYYGQNPININDYEDRIIRLEKQVKNLDNRLQKLENANADTTDNFYMI